MVLAIKFIDQFPDEEAYELLKKDVIRGGW